MWFILALLSLFLTVGYSIVNKFVISDKENDPLAYASVVQIFTATIAVIIYIAIINFTVDKIDYTNDFLVLRSSAYSWLFILNGILYGAGSALYFKALKSLPVSVVTILFSLIGINSLILGTILKIDHFSLAKLLGAILIITSIGLISYSRGEIKFNKNTFIMFIATIFYSLGAITDSNIIHSTKLTPLLFQSVSYILTAITVVIINVKNLSNIANIITDFSNLKYTALGAFFCFTYALAMYYSYYFGGTASSITMILSCESVLVVLASALLLNERSNFNKKIIASVITAVGVYLLSLTY